MKTAIWYKLEKEEVNIDKKNKPYMTKKRIFPTETRKCAIENKNKLKMKKIN